MAGLFLNNGLAGLKLPGLLSDPMPPAPPVGLLADSPSNPVANTLRQYQEAMAPSEADKKTALWSALAAMGAGIGGAQGTYGGLGPALSQGLTAGNSAYDNSLEAKRKANADAFAVMQKLRAGTAGKKGLNPVWLRDQDGNYVPGQLDEAGGLSLATMPEGYSAAPQVTMQDLGGYRQGYDKFGRPFGGPVQKTMTPAQQLENDPTHQKTIAQEKAEGAAVGQAKGAQTGKELKQAYNAKDILAVLDDAEPLIKQSTGSGVGKLVDMGAGLVGVSTAGAEAGDQLSVLGNKLVMMVPRFEGPQSDSDTKSYQKAAGDLQNTAIPRERRLAALQIIRKLNEKYANAPVETGGAPKAPAVQGGKLSAQQQMEAIQQARAAVAAGKDKNAINQRLRELGVSFQVP